MISMRCFVFAGLVSALFNGYGSPVANAQCETCVQPAYRLQCQTVYEERQVCAYRLVLETVCEERQITRKIPVWETESRERRTMVTRPVRETNIREERYMVQRPVVETYMRDCSYNRVRDIVIAGTARTIGVDVTDQDLTQNLIDRFEGPINASETLDALTETGRVALDLFLTTFSVAEADYREWLRGRIYLEKLQTHFIETAPETAEQVFIEWVITTSSVTAQEAIDRHDAGEAFADLADELTGPTPLSGEGGVVGWVPQGAFTELDPFLFGAETELNTLIGPLTTSFGSMVVRVTDGPAEQPIEESMRSLLGGTNLQLWLDAQVVDAVVENLGLTVDDSNWVIDQII